MTQTIFLGAKIETRKKPQSARKNPLIKRLFGFKRKRQAPTEAAREWKEKYEALVRAIEEAVGPQVLTVFLRLAERKRTGEKTDQ